MKKCSIAIVALTCIMALFLQGCTFLTDIGENLGIDMQRDLSAVEVYVKCAPSVVEITAKNSVSKKTGTGFFIDAQGTVVTNYHVIESCTDVQISLYNGQIYRVDCVLGYDAARDIAILDTSCTESVPLEFGTEEAYTGQPVYTLGSSLGLTGTFSDGMVSTGKRLLNDKQFIQITAPISPGNSGGPLLDTKGRVIGVNTACMVDGQNLNFAVPIGDVSKVATDENTEFEDLFTRKSSGSSRVKLLRSWSFGWSEDEECYILSFELCDQTGNTLNMGGTVDIEIVNDKGTTVYKKTLTFFASDHIAVQTSFDEKKLAAIRIPYGDISVGATYDGAVSFTVSGTGFSFDTAMARAGDLPSSY